MIFPDCGCDQQAFFTAGLDFNNILMAILGYADLALLDTDPGSPAVSSLHEIEKVTRDAADLSKQMLAYSGKGTFQIIKLNINQIIQ